MGLALTYGAFIALARPEVVIRWIHGLGWGSALGTGGALVMLPLVAMAMSHADLMCTVYDHIRNRRSMKAAELLGFELAKTPLSLQRLDMQLALSKAFKMLRQPRRGFAILSECENEITLLRSDPDLTPDQREALDHREASLLMNRSALQMIGDRPEIALQTAWRARRDFPKSYSARNNYVSVMIQFAKQNQSTYFTSTALREARETATLFPDVPSVLNVLTQALLQAGLNEEALGNAQRALHCFGNDPAVNIIYHQAVAAARPANDSKRKPFLRAA